MMENNHKPGDVFPNFGNYSRPLLVFFLFQEINHKLYDIIMTLTPMTLVLHLSHFSPLRYRLHSDTGCIYLTLYFQMSPQIASIRGGEVTLTAFVNFFSSVYFQMFP